MELLTKLYVFQDAEDLDGSEEETEKVVKAPKKKGPKLEENKSKKEHVNVVFIVHVGK